MNELKECASISWGGGLAVGGSSPEHRQAGTFEGTCIRDLPSSPCESLGKSIT